MSDERRRAPRLAARLEAAYEDAHRQIFLATRDVSASGVFLIDPDPPAPGERGQVALALPGDRAIVRLRGVVARRSSEDETPVGFALRFDAESRGGGNPSPLEQFLGETSSGGDV